MNGKYIHRYRNRIDIIAQLLDAASNGSTKTKMMYKAMLSHEQLKEYLQMMTENELINYDKGSQRFTTAHKGHEFMETYEDLSKLISPLSPMLIKQKKDK